MRTGKIWQQMVLPVLRAYLSSLSNIRNTFHMFIAEANLAPETCIQSCPVTRKTMKRLGVELLTGCLMLELVVFAQPHVARKATEQTASVIPYHTLTLYACGIHQWTWARMSGKAFSGVAYKSFTEITYGSHQTKTCTRKILQVRVPGLKKGNTQNKLKCKKFRLIQACNAISEI